nr:ABC transporter permease subunit [Vampirovibrio sp.]
MLHIEDLLQSWQLLAQGLGNTVFIALLAGVLSLTTGTILGILYHRQTPILSQLTYVYVQLIRSLPLILFLVFVHYGLLPIIILQPNFLFSAIIAFSLFESAYIAEIIRAGMASIKTEERDAAKSLGLNKTQRITLIYLPLATRRT